MSKIIVEYRDAYDHAQEQKYAEAEAVLLESGWLAVNFTSEGYPSRKGRDLYSPHAVIRVLKN